MRKAVLFLILLLVVGGGVGGLLYVYKRGLKKEDVLKKALDAFKWEKYELAAERARAVLASNPKSDRARTLLIRALFRLAKQAEGALRLKHLDEAEALAQEWYDRKKDAEAAAQRPAARFLITAHLIRGRSQLIQQRCNPPTHAKVHA